MYENNHTKVKHKKFLQIIKEAFLILFILFYQTNEVVC
jgi:hypothetical protein